MKKMRYGFLVGLILGCVVTAAVTVVIATQSLSERQAINLPGRTTAAPFSDSVLAGDTLYLSGRLGMDPATGKPPDTPEQEARNILDGMQQVLAVADMTMDDLVQVQVFCSDVSFYGAFNSVYSTYFSEAPPARAFVGAGTLLRGARFEVQGIAYKG